MRLSTRDCLRRGLASLKANRELVLVQWLGGLAVTLLTGLGGALPLVALGYDLATTDVLGDPDRMVSDVLPRLEERLANLGAALLGTTIVWTLALGLHCWLQAGTYGILAAADRRAPPALPEPPELPETTPGGAPPIAPAAFRAFRWRAFASEAGRGFGRFFGFVNLWGAAAGLWVAGLFVGMAATLGGAAHWGAGAAAGIGCGGALPLGFALAVGSLGYGVAQADLPRPGSGVLAATRTGLEVLSRRFAAVALLTGAFLGGFLLLVGALSLASLGGEVLLRHRPLSRSFLEAGLTLLASGLQGVAAVGLGASLVALVRSETARSPAL